MESKSPSPKTTLLTMSVQVVAVPATVQVSTVLIPFLRIRMVADPPAPGAAVRLTTNLLAVPDGSGTLALASVALLVDPQGIRKVLLAVLA